MGIREALNQNPRAATAITFGVIFGSLAFIGVEMYLNRQPPAPVPPAHAYYTTDEGDNLFLDDADLVPPFNHDGQPALRARVFTCDHGKTRFVAFLERLAPDAANNVPPDPTARREYFAHHLEVRAPHSNTWVSAGDATAAPLRAPRCPDGSPASADTP